MGVKKSAAKDLFNGNGRNRKLDNGRSKTFHITVAKGLFMYKRARPGIQIAIVLLCTSVQESDKDDWNNMIRLIKYLKDKKSYF